MSLVALSRSSDIIVNRARWGVVMGVKISERESGREKRGPNL